MPASESTASSIQTALLASHELLSTMPQHHPARPNTPPATPRICAPTSQPVTPKLKTHSLNPRTPKTPHQAMSLSTPTAPRKRPRSTNYHIPLSASPPSTPLQRPCTLQVTPTNRRSRKKILPLDKTICIPLHVLRAQVADTSALLQAPARRRCERLRRAVDRSVERECWKLRAGPVGILEAAVWMPGQKD